MNFQVKFTSDLTVFFIKTIQSKSFSWQKFSDLTCCLSIVPGSGGEDGLLGLPGQKGESGRASLPGAKRDTGEPGQPGRRGEPGLNG